MKLYHYSDKKIESIDMNKCDGFWMTTIAPTDTDMLDEIGCAGSKYCHVVEFNDDVDFEMNGAHHNVEEFLLENKCEYILNRYDGFNDYATCNTSLVKIIEIIEM